MPQHRVGNGCQRRLIELLPSHQPLGGALFGVDGYSGCECMEVAAVPSHVFQKQCLPGCWHAVPHTPVDTVTCRTTGLLSGSVLGACVELLTPMCFRQVAFKVMLERRLVWSTSTS